MSLPLFDEELFDGELFDFEMGGLEAPTLTVSGMLFHEPPQRTWFTSTIIGYMKIRRQESHNLTISGIISRRISDSLVASVEAITRFNESITIDSFILPDEAPAEMWDSIPAETWEMLLEKKS